MFHPNVMYLFFKAEQYGLFDAPATVSGHVRKKTGRFVAPYQATRKHRQEQVDSGDDLISIMNAPMPEPQMPEPKEKSADEWDGFKVGDYGAGSLRHGENGRLVLTIPPGVIDGSPTLRKKLKDAGFTAQKNDEWWHKRPRYLVEGAGYQSRRNVAARVTIPVVSWRFLSRLVAGFRCNNLIL